MISNRKIPFQHSLYHISHYTYGTLSTQRLRAPFQYQAPYDYLYNKIGCPDYDTDEGLDCINWFIENQRVYPANQFYDKNGNIDRQIQKLNKPYFADIKFQSGKLSAYEFLTNPIHLNVYSIPSNPKYRFCTNPQDQQFYWNPLIIKDYFESYKDTFGHSSQISGPPSIGKSSNLRFYALLIKIYCCHIARVFYVQDPYLWYKDPIAYFVSELQMMFGYELSFSDGFQYVRSHRLFYEVFKIALNTKKSQYRKMEMIIEKIRPLLDYPNIKFLLDMTSLSQLDENIKQKVVTSFQKDIEFIKLMLNENGTAALYLTNNNNNDDEDLSLGQMYKNPYSKSIDHSLPKDSAIDMLSSTYKNDCLTYQQSIEILQRIGTYPGYIEEFVQGSKECNSVEESLKLFEAKQSEDSIFRQLREKSVSL